MICVIAFVFSFVVLYILLFSIMVGVLATQLYTVHKDTIWPWADTGANPIGAVCVNAAETASSVTFATATAHNRI